MRRSNQGLRSGVLNIIIGQTNRKAYAHSFMEDKYMAKDGSVLDTNDKFPEIELQLVSGETIRLPEATGEGYSVVLFYRGGW